MTDHFDFGDGFSHKFHKSPHFEGIKFKTYKGSWLKDGDIHKHTTKFLKDHTLGNFHSLKWYSNNLDKPWKIDFLK